MASKSKQATVETSGNGKAKKTMPAPMAAANPMEVLRREVEDVFDRFTRGLPTWPWRRGEVTDFDPFKDMRMPFAGMPFGFDRLEPRTDVREDDKGYEITVELPGLDDGDVAVTVSDNAIAIKGEKKVEHETDEEGYHLHERGFGAFQRSFRLPDDVDAEKIGATFAKGVLTVVLPKSEAAKAKVHKIKVKAE